MTCSAVVIIWMWIVWSVNLARSFFSVHISFCSQRVLLQCYLFACGVEYDKLDRSFFSDVSLLWLVFCWIQYLYFFLTEIQSDHRRLIWFQYLSFLIRKMQSDHRRAIYFRIFC